MLNDTQQVTENGIALDSLKSMVANELHAFLVPGMKDDIYFLSSLLQKNPHTGAKEKIAIFTAKGAIVLTAESCQGLIQRALYDSH